MTIFPLFEECSKYTLDPYWREIFINCANNNFPQNVCYDSFKSVLIIKCAEGESTISLPSVPTETFKLVQKTFKEQLGLISNKDIKTKIENVEINLDCEWKKIKPKNIRDQILFEYAVTLKEKHKLSDKELRSLWSIMQLGFQFHSFTFSNVEYSDGVITNIIGLEFDKKTRKFMIPSFKPIPIKQEKPAKTGKLYLSLDKFVKEQNARINKTSSNNLK